MNGSVYPFLFTPSWTGEGQFLRSHPYYRLTSQFILTEDAGGQGNERSIAMPERK